MIVLSDNNNKVVGSFLDGTTVTNLSGVTTLPTPETKIGKNAVLKINTADNTLYYDYEDRPQTEAEQMAELQATVKSLQTATAAQLGV